MSNVLKGVQCEKCKKANKPYVCVCEDDTDELCDFCHGHSICRGCNEIICRDEKKFGYMGMTAYCDKCLFDDGVFTGMFDVHEIDAYIDLERIRDAEKKQQGGKMNNKKPNYLFGWTNKGRINERVDCREKEEAK